MAKIIHKSADFCVCVNHHYQNNV